MVKSLGEPKFPHTSLSTTKKFQSNVMLAIRSFSFWMVKVVPGMVEAHSKLFKDASLGQHSA